jgi:hypothetical protein
LARSSRAGPLTNESAILANLGTGKRPAGSSRAPTGVKRPKPMASTDVGSAKAIQELRKGDGRARELGH